MYQTFEVTARPEQGPPRLLALRRVIASEGLDGFLVPRADAHQGEYVADHDARLAWLTGFTGSAGFCAVLENVAGVFIDGRYRTQVKAQVADVFTPVPWPEVSLADWLIRQLPNGGRIGIDPWLHTMGQIAELKGALKGSGVDLYKPRIWWIGFGWINLTRQCGRSNRIPLNLRGKVALINARIWRRVCANLVIAQPQSRCRIRSCGC